MTILFLYGNLLLQVQVYYFICVFSHSLCNAMMPIVAKLTAVLAVFGLSAPLITTCVYLGAL